MSLLKKLAGETALYGLSSIVGRFLNYLLVPLYTRQFLQGEYGVVNELYAYSGFLMVLFSYRMESAFFRFGTPEAARERTYSTASRALWTSSLVFLALIWLFAQPIANILQYRSHPEYIRWFALLLAFDALCELPFAQLRLEQRSRRFVAIKLFNIGLNIALNLFWILLCPWAAKQGYGWAHLVWSPSVGVGYVFLSNVLASGATLLVLSPIALRLKAGFDAPLFKQMLRYSGPLVITGLAGIVNEMLDRAMLTRLLPGTLAENRAQLGIYGANYKLAMLITLFTQAYRYAAEPFFFKTADNKDALRLQADATKWFTIAGSAGVLAILLFLDLLKHFIGKAYHEGLTVVPILLFANLFLGIYYNVSVWYRLKDRTHIGAWVSMGGAAVTVLLNLWWVPVWGYVGAAWATLVCYLFMAAVTWWTGRGPHPVPYPIGRILFYPILAAVLYFFQQYFLGFEAGLTINYLVEITLFCTFLAVIWFNEIR